MFYPPFCLYSRINKHLGEHKIAVIEGTEYYSDTTKVIHNPRYNYSLDNEIMLIKRNRAVALNRYVGTVSLPSSCPSTRIYCPIPGWGNTLSSGGHCHYTDTMRCLVVPVLSDTNCRSSYPRKITSNMFSSGFLEGGNDSCKGDSGGPVVCNGQLQAVVSWGYGCAQANRPEVYTKVCNYHTWTCHIISSN
ncbi:trypsin-3-like [Girardinichthys multiradiatus]|uniref:trypsin-3-like n=1 Tax=Girardinichthys multiradiatus TaxID=208333 RepID=UPI001FAE4E72|nr:trypsin-3-like [Girardinichthys multiradiatus]